MFSVLTARADPAAGVLAAPPPDWVKTAPLPPIGPERENPTGQDYLLVDQQANVATGESYYRRAFQIVSDEGRRDGAQVNISFDPSYQSLTIHHLRLRRGAEVSDRLDLAKIQLLQQERDLDRQLYNGERSAFLILDDVRVGDIIDLAYTIKGQNPVFGGRFIDVVALGWGVPVSELRCRVLTPDNRPVNHHLRGTSAATFTEMHSDGQDELLWVCHDLPAIESETKIPPGHIVFPFVELTEFASWAQVVDWALPLYELKPVPGPLLRETAATLNQPGLVPEALAISALRFVQEEIRYLGIEMGPGSHHPSEPEDVLRRRFGDCKDKARLLTALLQQLGFQAAPVLVHSARRASVHDWLPSPYAFDHVVVALELDGRRYILDPTMSYQRGDSLNLRHVGTYGPYLRLAPGNQALEDAPGGASDVFRTIVSEDFTVKAFAAPATFTVLTTADGRSADNLRAYFATHSREQIGRSYLDYYTHYYPGISSTQAVEFRDNPLQDRVQVTEHYQVTGLFAKTGTNPRLRAEFYPTLIGEYVRIPNLNQRKHPFAVSYPLHTEYNTVVHLPEDWTLKNSAQSVVDEAFDLKATYAAYPDKSVALRYVWDAKAPAVAVARLEEFTANIQQAKQVLGYTLTYNTAVATKAYPPNWPMIALAVGVLALSGTVSGWLVLKRNPDPLPPLVPAEPPAGPSDQPNNPAPAKSLEGLGGWLILVGLGLVWRPFYLLSAIARSHRAYFNRLTWQVLTEPGYTSYQPQYAFVATVDLTCNLLLFMSGVLLLLLFFRRSYLFPRAMQIFLVAQVPLSLVFLWTSSLVTRPAAADAAQQADHYKMLAQVLLAAAIWVPYFQYSRRVKLTFTR